MPDNKYKSNIPSKLKPIDYYVGKYVEIVCTGEFCRYTDLNGVKGLFQANSDEDYDHVYAVMTNHKDLPEEVIGNMSEIEDGEYIENTYNYIVEVFNDDYHGYNNDGKYNKYDSTSFYLKEIDQDNIDYGL